MRCLLVFVLLLLVASSSQALNTKNLLSQVPPSLRLFLNLHQQFQEFEDHLEKFVQQAKAQNPLQPPPCPQHPLPYPIPMDPLPESVTIGLDLAEEFAKFLLNKTFTTSAYFALIYDGEVFAERAFNSSGSPMPDENTIYRIGSLSKVFTDVMLMSLRDQGLVQLDDPISKFYPDFSIPSYYQSFDGVDSSQGITLRHLATQLSGLPSGSPCNFVEPNCNITTEQALENLRESYLVHPPNLEPHYSDGAYALLGRVLETPAGQTWEQFLDEEILKPLGMTSTGWSFDDDVIKRLPEPLLGPIKMGKLGYLDMDWARPTGGMWSCGKDIVQFVKMFLNSYPDPVAPLTSNPESPLPSKISLREMLLPSYVNIDQISAFGFPFEWSYSKSAKSWMIGKGGLFPGYSANMIMVPNARYGCVALSNSVAGASLCSFVTDIVLPFLFEAMKTYAQPLPNPGNLTSFEGIYTSSIPGFPGIQSTLNVTTFTNGTIASLALVTEGASAISPPAYLTWRDGNTFIYQVSPAAGCETAEIGSGGEEVEFSVNGSEVISFTTPGTEPYFGITWTKAM